MRYHATRPPIKRMKAIDQALQAKKWPNDRMLAADLEVDRRTIRRDLEFLRAQYHAPIEFDRAHQGNYYTEPTFRIALPQFTHGELIALFLAERMMHQFRGTPFIGHCHLRADIRMFAVQSVLSLRDSGETFDWPADFQVDEYLKGSFRTVRGDGDYLAVLRFGRDVARRFAEKRLHTN
jgi:predicted DNA-binding transcriptional regulator YafY